MKKQLLAIGSTLLVALLATAPARAETVMLEQTGLVSGRQSYVVPLQIDSRGQMSVRLSDLGWAGSLVDLSFSLSRTNGMLNANPAMASLTSGGPSNAQGAKVFDITEPGTYYACISGKAVGPYNLGLYGLRIAFAAADSPPAVPLPAAVWLLLSGLGGLCSQLRRQVVRL
jgi:hypothetical protein